VESAFGLHMMQYQDADGNNFYAPDADPKLPAAIAARLDHIVGLHNEPIARPVALHLTPRSSVQQIEAAVYPFVLSSSMTANGIGTGLGGGLSPSDIKNAYGLSGVNLTGAGQAIVLFECDGYIASDITTYEDQYGLPHIPLQNVYIDSVTGVPASSSYVNPQRNGPLEVVLDIELAAAIAPGTSSILVYECPNTDLGWDDAYAQMVNDNVGRQISTSWGSPEATTSSNRMAHELTYFGELAAGGRCIYAASGDNGVALDPATQPSAVGVGGTTLTTQGPGGVWQSETVWNETIGTSSYSSGGGVSGQWSIPSYQQGRIPASSGGSQTMRNCPDVALNAAYSSGYSVYFSDPAHQQFGPGYYTADGTSAAAPIWAAFTALVNQQRLANSNSVIGFTNPALYQIASGPRYASDFHDITTGASPYHSAGVGYDLVTGLGSFNGANLLFDLAPMRGDFNGDGYADILWQHQQTGQISIWHMNDTQRIDGPIVATVFLSWKIVGCSDFNGDGHQDILWQNQQTNQLSIWHMNDTQRIDGPVFAGSTDPNWKVVGTADFNGDGHPDILWQNLQSGQLSVWYMNDTQVLSTPVFAGSTDINWKIVGCADFNGDGRPDILWQNQQTGQLSVWYMAGTQELSSTVFAGSSDLNWKVVGTADFNGDGHPDILWQNQQTGQDSIWHMNNVQKIDGPIFATVTDLNWLITGPR